MKKIKKWDTARLCVKLALVVGAMILVFLLVFLPIFFAGMGASSGMGEAFDQMAPTERGLAWVALAIAFHALIHGD